MTLFCMHIILSFLFTFFLSVGLLMMGRVGFGMLDTHSLVHGYTSLSLLNLKLVSHGCYAGSLQLRCFIIMTYLGVHL